MPWLDTGIGSSNSSDVPCQDTRIESGTVVVNRYSLARYRNRIFELFRRALSRYRNRVWYCSRQQILPGEIQESDLESRRSIAIIFVLTFVLKRQTLVICDVVMYDMRDVLRMNEIVCS